MWEGPCGSWLWLFVALLAATASKSCSSGVAAWKASAFIATNNRRSSSSSSSSSSSTPFHTRQQPTSPTTSTTQRCLWKTSTKSNSPSLPPLSKDEIARYSRHLVLGQVGMEGQRTLKDASVLVIGAGGLGSSCLMYLAAAGVGHIGIVDHDTVDVSNLQRQILHGTSTIGKPKCASALQRLKDINPLIQIRTYDEELTSTTALRILGEGFAPGRLYQVVVDGSDNFPTKYLINDACDMLGLTWVYSAILGFEGQLSVFNLDGQGPTYRDLLPVPPPPGDVPSCAEGGVLGVLPGTMGCLQATEVIKILLGRRDGVLSGRVMVFDALSMKFSEVGLQKLDPEDRPLITELIDYQGFCAGPNGDSSQQQKQQQHHQSSNQQPSQQKVNGSQQQQQQQQQLKHATMEVLGHRTMDEGEPDISVPQTFHEIGPRDCLERLSNGWSPWVLDVRLPTEHAIVSLPFTDEVAPHRMVRVDHIPRSGDVLVYCKGGVRGKKACQRLVNFGVDPDRLYNLEGGIMRWQQDVDPAMPRY